LALPIDVVEEIIKRFDTLDAEVTGMLHYIFMENDLARIADYLDRRGKMADPTEDWSTAGRFLLFDLMGGEADKAQQRCSLRTPSGDVLSISTKGGTQKPE
jgi:hypothetical protein